MGLSLCAIYLDTAIVYITLVCVKRIAMSIITL